MKNSSTRGAAVALLGLLLLVGAPWIGEVRGDRPVDEAAMKKKMNAWARELGVKCAYCHVQQGRTFDYEAETPLKRVAHVCDEKFVQRLELQGRPVSCADCHDRKTKIFPARDGAAPPTPAPGGGG